MENAELEVKIQEPTFRCRNCNREFKFSDLQQQVGEVKNSYDEEYPLHLMPELLPAFTKCPCCGSHDIEAIGQEIYIEKVEEYGAFERVS